MSADPAVAEQFDEEITFDTEEEAIATRDKTLSLYNAGEYERALGPFLAILRHFTKKFGETNLKCAPHYLDYGLTLLGIVQGGRKPAEELALTNIDEEDAETCFLNLDAARVCYEKMPNAEEESDVQMRLAEVHDGLAQLALERDNSDIALTEFEAELLILRNLPDEKMCNTAANRRAIVSTMYNIARCYLFEADYTNSVDKLKACLDYITSLPKDTIEYELIDEIEVLYQDAVDNRDNKTFEKVKESIKELFPDEKKEVPTPAEVAKEYTSISNLVTELPGGDSSVSRLLAPAPYVLALSAENSNSTSRSVFPRQGTGEHSHSVLSAGGNSSGAVNTVVARKKPKPTTTTNAAVAVTAAPLSNGEPTEKKIRTE